MFDFPSKDFSFTTILAKNSKLNLRHFQKGFIWRMNFKNQIRFFGPSLSIYLENQLLDLVEIIGGKWST